MRLKPTLKLRIKHVVAQTAPLTAFNKLTEEAIEVTRNLDLLDQANMQRPSAESLLQETLTIENTSLKSVARLRAAIEDGSDGLEHTRATLRRMVTFLRGPNWSGPPTEPARLRFLSTDAANGELARIGRTPLELYCVAIQIAGTKHPGAFGSCDDPAGVSERISKLRARQKELFEKIEPVLGPHVVANSFVRHLIAQGKTST